MCKYYSYLNVTPVKLDSLVDSTTISMRTTLDNSSPPEKEGNQSEEVGSEPFLVIGELGECLWPPSHQGPKAACSASSEVN